jgi:hypothetical protein
MLRLFVKDKSKRLWVAHIAAGFIILIHSYEKYESGHNSYRSFLIAGVIFLAVAFFHPQIEKKAPWIDGLFFLIEAVLSMIVAADFFHLGKKALPYTYVLLSIFQIFMAFRRSRKGIVAHKVQGGGHHAPSHEPVVSSGPNAVSAVKADELPPGSSPGKEQQVSTALQTGLAKSVEDEMPPKQL